MDAATIDEVVAALGEAGLAVASGPVARSDGTALFVHDPDGARIELLVKHER
jgi:catechol 2,3-dioxygenase-like lactoylglutathione lyase family enzyme